MPSALKFLVVDDNTDSRFLLVKTLLRKFPHATIDEVSVGSAAVALAGTGTFDAMIVHRAAELDGRTLVGMLRAAQPATPIVMVSGRDRSREAREAGATMFLSYDEWLRIGTVIAGLLQADGSSEAAATPSAV